MRSFLGFDLVKPGSYVDKSVLEALAKARNTTVEDMLTEAIKTSQTKREQAAGIVGTQQQITERAQTAYDAIVSKK